ncbi:hypothetical protein KVT40_003726 [Elsinoe batatas]|uniref:NAD(P)-binding protein n=1 Tax=Elsinoe batatas TaxID=2601811 RepID=A0A8K0PHW1_9PEZI|nr:hypothetical protein KVT40_003726 [Elsinoe batatas]
MQPSLRSTSHLVHALPRPALLGPTPLSHRKTHTSPSPSPPSLSGLHALVTGASRGIGLSTAHLLASHGCHLTLIARTPSTLSVAQSTLPSPPPSSPPHRVVAGDISSRLFWKDLEQHIPRQERVDILVNSAGVSHQSLFLRTSEELVEQVVGTNLMGSLWGAKWVGRRMVRQGARKGEDEEKGEGKGQGGQVGKVGKGVIVNVASLLGTHGGMGSAAYAASKAGVIGFTRALAAELGPSGVRVNAVLPGYVQTDMTDAMTPGAREQAAARIPLKRFGTAEEVADAVLFLIQNGYAHNCVLNLDGGLSAT